MRGLLSLLTLLLLASVASNFYLYTKLVLLTNENALLQHQHSLATTNSRHSVNDKSALLAKPQTNEIPPTARQRLLAQFSAMLQQSQFTDLQLLLRQHLSQQPDDMEVLLLEAELIVKTEPMSHAIEHYYAMLKMPLADPQRQYIIEQIERLSGNAIDKLQQAQAWDILAMFTEPLLQLAPTNKLYILALATAYAQQQQPNLMESTLASLAADDIDAAKVRKLITTSLPDATPAPQQPAYSSSLGIKNMANAIALQRQGAHFVVNAKLSNNAIRLMIDTGASTTAISQQAFAQLSPDTLPRFIGRFTINTAAGQIVAPMFEFEQLSINNYQVRNTTVLILPQDYVGSSDGLLGMNYLREFDFHLDHRNSLLLLQRFNANK